MTWKNPLQNGYFSTPATGANEEQTLIATLSDLKKNESNNQNQVNFIFLYFLFFGFVLWVGKQMRRNACIFFTQIRNFFAQL